MATSTATSRNPKNYRALRVTDIITASLGRATRHTLWLLRGCPQREQFQKTVMGSRPIPSTPAPVLLRLKKPIEEPKLQTSTCRLATAITWALDTQPSI